MDSVRDLGEHQRGAGTLHLLRDLHEPARFLSFGGWESGDAVASRKSEVVAVCHRQGGDMHIQIINFHLKDLSEADFRAHADEVAPAFAEVPGLISKVWLANRATNTYGGLYTWASRDAMDEYAKSDLFKAVATNPNLAGITSIDFNVLEEPSSVTRGLAEVPA